MKTLTSKQRAFLRSQAHALKPVLQVGAEGLSEAVLKVKVLESAPENAKTTAARISESLKGVHVPQVIGRTVVLYRPDPEEPSIKLP